MTRLEQAKQLMETEMRKMPQCYWPSAQTLSLMTEHFVKMTENEHELIAVILGYSWGLLHGYGYGRALKYMGESFEAAKK